MAEAPFIEKELKKLKVAKREIVVDPLARDSEGNAEFIAAWIRDNLKSTATLMIIGSDWQDPRFRAIIGGVFERMKLHATIVPVGAGFQWKDGATDPKVSTGPGPLADRIQIERTAIYRDSARALGHYDYCDFQPAKGESEKEQTSQAILGRTRSLF